MKIKNEFVHDVQHLSGQSYDALSSELQAQAQAFLQATHESSMRKLEAFVEIEQWKQARGAVLALRPESLPAKVRLALW